MNSLVSTLSTGSRMPAVLSSWGSTSNTSEKPAGFLIFFAIEPLKRSLACPPGPGAPPRRVGTHRRTVDGGRGDPAHRLLQPSRRGAPHRLCGPGLEAE